MRMVLNLKTAFQHWLLPWAIILLAISPCGFCQNHEIVLAFDPAKTTVNFTLGDVIHTIHGAFDLKRGSINFNPESGGVGGDIVINAASGRSGNNTRDRKMHREVLESDRYPEITFRADRLDGKVATPGTTTVPVHGTFSVHGTAHEITIPVRVEMADDHWSATAHFVIPYVKWGMKNPSTFILRVSESVEIDLHASGSTPRPNGSR
jgi:polyisoprenoid-binding protein YceI